MSEQELKRRKAKEL